MKTKFFLTILVMLAIILSGTVQAETGDKEFSFMISGFEKNTYLTSGIKNHIKKIIENTHKESTIKVIGFSDKTESEEISKKRAYIIAKLINEKTNITKILYKGAGLGKMPSDELNRAVQIIIWPPAGVNNTKIKNLPKNVTLLDEYEEGLKEVKATPPPEKEKKVEEKKLNQDDFSKIVENIKNYFAGASIIGKIVLSIFVIIIIIIFVVMIVAQIKKQRAKNEKESEENSFGYGDNTSKNEEEDTSDEEKKNDTSDDEKENTSDEKKKDDASDDEKKDTSDEEKKDDTSDDEKEESDEEKNGGKKQKK